MKIASAWPFVFALATAPAFAQTTAPPQKNPALDGLLDRGSAYVCSFMREFSTVVAEERYVQDSHPMHEVDLLSGGSVQAAPQHAEVLSDLLFVTPDPAHWLPFRDVYSVNGRPVRDREQRLARLFINQEPDAVDRAGQIAREGFRYNLGSPDRTIANPLLALGFLQPEYRGRFEFKLAGIDTARGADVWIVKFKERVRPTLLRTPDNRNVVTQGRFWINGASGRVLQTELETSAGDKVMTIFAYDERLRLDVPVEMRDIAWSNRAAITGTATYTNFRRFGVATDEKFR